MTSANNNVENEFSKLLESWRENHESHGYDALKFYTACADILEEQTVQFHSGDPDPFDDRHPKYVKPGCTFGKLLVAMGTYSDLLGELVENFRVKQDLTSSPSPRVITAARFMLAAKPGLNMQAIHRDTGWLIVRLHEWVKEADEPLRTYATGLLVGSVEPQIANSDYSSLVTVLLKRLWGHLRPEKDYMKGKSGHINKKASESSNTTVNSQERTHIKRKLSDQSKNQASKKLLMDRPGHDVISSRRKSSDYHETVFVETMTSSPSWRAEILESDLSNSSWSEQMSFVIGCSYSLRPPLSSNVCQRFILDFLKCFGEYQDLLSIFLELKALDIIGIYLHEKKNDGLLTFKALEFLASLLCHNKVATEFIELNGVQNLLTVQRPSMGSTGVAVCLYYLAYKKDAMERVCQLPPRVLVELVKYAVWLLECSHESGRSHAALFFSISFSFRVILGLFDQMNALRCLVNMISTSSPIVNSTEDDQDSRDSENEQFTRQAARTVCSALKKYFEAHLVLKIFSIQRSFNRPEERYFPVQSIPKYKAMDCSREQLFEYLEFLIMVQESDAYISNSHLAQWQPLLNFIKLDGLALVLKVIVLACEWSSFAGRVEVVRSALDVLAVLTLNPKAQLALCEPDLMSHLNCKESGLEVVLGVAEGEHYIGHEGEAQKSALAVIVNCVCDFRTGYDGAIIMKGNMQRRLSSRTYDDSREKIWKCVQNNNGIRILISLLVVTDPAQHADDLRYLACKALLGLSNYRPVTQIMSKLPFFINGQVQSVTREPVLHDKKRQHTKLCKYVETLIERVSGRPSTTDFLDFETVRRSHIIAETCMQYSNKEVLQMVYNHLVWSGLHNAADVLGKEAGLTMDASSPTKPDTFVFPSPCRQRSSAVTRNFGNHSVSEYGSSGDFSRTMKNKRISFTKGSHAFAETPTPSPVINVLNATPHKKFRSRPKSGQSSTNGGLTKQSRFKLSSNGVVTVVPKKRSCGKKDNSGTVTLNAVIEEHFKHQHARCRNPVVTVPEFSLFRPHCCPEPHYRVEAPFNVTKRACYRQGICPRWGGIGGASCDRQLIYSRYRPSYIFKGTENRKVSCSSVAFMPRGDRLLIGDYQGDLTVFSIDDQGEQVVQGLAGEPITYLEPSRGGETLLVASEGVWNSVCSLYATADNFVQRATFEDVYHVEFSKLTQDRVIGTKEHKATIFDVNTGQVVDVFERPDMASNYTDNRATFSYTDDLVLSDGLLWDVRRPHTHPIHKFDKFNTAISGVFHPRSLEVLINTEVWDLRNFHLLHFVPSLDQCSLVFNKQGNILYAVKKKKFADIDISEDEAPSAFRTLDGYDYKQLAFVAVRHHIYDLSVDNMDHNVAVVETLVAEDGWEEPSNNVCRLYEVGMTRGDDEEEEESNFDEESIRSSGSSGASDDGASSYGSLNLLQSIGSASDHDNGSSIGEDDHDLSGQEDGWETLDDDSLLDIDDDDY